MSSIDEAAGLSTLIDAHETDFSGQPQGSVMNPTGTGLCRCWVEQSTSWSRWQGTYFAVLLHSTVPRNPFRFVASGDSSSVTHGRCNRQTVHPTPQFGQGWGARAATASRQWVGVSGAQGYVLVFYQGSSVTSGTTSLMNTAHAVFSRIEPEENTGNNPALPVPEFKSVPIYHAVVHSSSTRLDCGPWPFKRR